MNDADVAAADRRATPRSAREARYRAYLSLDALFPFEPFEPHWVGDDGLWFVVADADGPALHFVDLARGAPTTPPLPLSSIASAFGVDVAAGRLPIDRVERTAGGLRIHRGDTAIDHDATTGALVRVDADEPVRPGRWKRHLTLTTGVPADDVVAPDGTRFATIVDGDVVIVTRRDGARRRLTDDAGGDVRWELESGRIPFAGCKPWTESPWSPDGAQLYAARVDRSAVPTIPTIDFLGDTVVVDRMHAEAPGRPMPTVRGSLFDVATGARIAIDWGDTRESLQVFVGWMRDGVDCWFVRFSRDLARAEVLAVGRDGAVRTVFVEETSTFQRIQHDLLYPGNTGIALLPDGSGFVWLSSRSGWQHIDRVSRDGRDRRALTSGAWPVVAIEGVDAANRVFFTAHADAARPYDTQLWRVSADGGDAACLTPGTGDRTIALSPSRTNFVAVRSTVSEPPVAIAADADGTVLRTLHRTDIAPLRALGWRPPEEVVVKALDGVTDVWGVLYLPADFDPAGRYPVVEHIYAGPQVAYAPHRFGTGERYRPWNLAHALAQLGFAVVVVDTPGTPGRSKRFHDVVHRAMGTRIVREHASAIRRIAATRPFLDVSRTGIYGHSWGALFAVRALAEADGLYRCAVASGPGLEPDNLMVEPYLGSDPDDDAYRAYSPRALADRIPSDALLLVAGTAEAPMLHASLRMSHALIEAGVRHELIVLPGQSHGYAGAAADYVLDATTRFFERRLAASGDGRDR